jgi:hypothetical protein
MFGIDWGKKPPTPPMPPRPPLPDARPGTLAILIEQLRKQGKCCLITSDGTCHIGIEPLELAARAHDKEKR